MCRLEPATRHLTLLAEVSRRLASSLDYATTVQSVARVAIPELADWCAVDIPDGNGSIRRVAVAHVDPAREQATRELALLYTPSAMALEGVPKVLRTHAPELICSVSEAPDSEHVELLRHLGMRSGVVLPLVARERMLGALSLASASQARYCRTDVELAEELASRGAMAIDNARLFRLAQDAIAVRDTFLATVSHDLKNPLATIRGQAQLLRRLAARDNSPLSARVDDGMRRMQATADRMSRILDGLLDVTSLELGGRLDLDRQPTDLVEVVGRIAAEHQERAPQHLIRVAGEPKLVGVWDLARLERVVDNLLGNAVKYSPDGSVVTVVCVREDDDDGAWAIVSVRDQGVGIPVADLGHIFERFHRAGNVGGVRGAGIGLATVREIVEQHGGSISVESRQGEGSTFTVRLPMARPDGVTSFA
jgi:signal transduction histidine kinase